MWFATFLLILLIALIIIVIMDTAMKLALMITTLYNYDTKKLFVPATLTVALWTVLLVGCYRTINTQLDNNALDIFFSMIFEHSLITEYKGVIIKSLSSTFLIGTILQSFTYYTVNINYQKVEGAVRFSFKKLFKKIFSKITKKNIGDTKENAVAQIERQPKKLTFPRAIITSIISVIITLAAIYGLFVFGEYLSQKISTKL